VEIIDAQIHELGPIKPWNSALGPESSLVVACELAIAAMDAVGVDRALIHARGDLCDFAASHYGERLGAYKTADAKAADIESAVAEVPATPGLVAMRAILGFWRTAAPPEELRTGVFEPLFSAAEKHNVPLFCYIPGFPEDLAPVARAHPNLTLIVDHLGLPQQPTPVDHEPFQRLEQLLTLAQFPNIAVKLCGMHTLSRQPYPWPDIWPHMHKVINAFGPERLMWASDFTRLRFADGTTNRAPRQKWYGLYSESLKHIVESSELSTQDKEMILGGTVRRLLHWPSSAM
jgi:L-fuconolactonase